MKRSFKYRFYPTDAQAVELSRTFGCVRKVCNPALAARAEAWKAGGERMGYGQTSAMLTAWKKTGEPAFPATVSSVPLQQALRHLQSAFVTFWTFWEKRSRYPRFKSKRKSRASAEYTRSGFRCAEGRVRPAKTDEPASKNRIKARTRAALCSACGAIADAMPLSVREWTCASCGTAHDRDGNAALNSLAAGPAAAACGADVRPHRESSSRSGRSVAQQESPLVSVGIPSR
ncbi:RNA-guided endonuclease InsQ/TnpB family protein [Streptomyces sp. NPDC001502]|uniref:RNA-guided endonuclease InsQ/TnpB family protein n=1 Tax=Streptomyces sp. NPDC001502 TaxID=3364578 RepID=UPI0036A6B694